MKEFISINFKHIALFNMNREKGVALWKVERKYADLYDKSLSDNHRKDKQKAIGMPLL